MENINQETTNTEKTCKKCKRVCQENEISSKSICYDCTQQAYSYSKGMIIKRILPWLVGGIIIAIAFGKEANFSIAGIILTAYIIYCLPWIIFANKDAAMRGVVLGMWSKTSSGLGLTEVAQATNTLWVIIKTLLTSVFVVPVKTVYFISTFFYAKSVLKNR